MSKVLEGKISNQYPRGGVLSKVKCACCSKTVDQPEMSSIKLQNHSFTIYSYLTTNLFIYETQSGRAVVYCSDKCRKSHNHRFQK